MTKWLALVFLLLLISCEPGSYEPPPSYGGTSLRLGGYWCNRVIDDQAEVVCYICKESYDHAYFMSCVPLADTALR